MTKNMDTMNQEKIDEVLEHIWVHEEDFQDRVDRAAVGQWIDPGSVDMVLAEMERNGLVRICRYLRMSGDFTSLTARS